MRLSFDLPDEPKPLMYSEMENCLAGCGRDVRSIERWTLQGGR